MIYAIFYYTEGRTKIIYQIFISRAKFYRGKDRIHG